MQYIQKFATKDQPAQNYTYKNTVGDKYFDKHGVLQPGHSNKFNIHHFAILALFQWGQENARAKEEMYKKHRLRFITRQTLFEYEVKTLVSMMHWDEFNKTFKIIMINNYLKKKGTSFKKLHETSELMLKEEERLSTAKMKREMRYGRNFQAAVRIQEWWLRKKRTFPAGTYKNLYQLIDKYSVPGGFTGQDSAKYFGMRKGENILKIQENIMNNIENRRAICHKMSKQFVGTVFKRWTTQCDKFCKKNPSSYDESPPDNKTSPSSFLGHWARRLGLTKN